MQSPAEVHSVARARRTHMEAQCEIVRKAELEKKKSGFENLRREFELLVWLQLLIRWVMPPREKMFELLVWPDF